MNTTVKYSEISANPELFFAKFSYETKNYCRALIFNCYSVFGQVQTTETPLNTTILNDSGALQKRAIRRNIPLTNSIQKAYRSGTRDTSGRPGPNYWQLKTDYSINASLNPETQTITGSETIALHNNSADKLDRIVLRLDHNIYRPRVPRGFSVPAETTEGMVVTRIKINGTEIDLKASPPRQSNQGQQQKIEKSFVIGLDQTVATVVLAEPIEARSVATIEIDWQYKIAGRRRRSRASHDAALGEQTFPAYSMVSARGKIR